MTFVTADEVSALWLRTTVPEEPGTTAVCTTGVKSEGADVVVGIDHLGRRHLLIPLAPKETLKVAFRSSGIRVTAPRPLLMDGHSLPFLDVYCTRHELANVFARVAAELINEAIRPLPDPGRRCIAIIESWKGLFGAGAGGFAREHAIGLLGELWVLERLTRIAPDAIALWTGPLGGVHDFRNRVHAIEVKTTVRRHGRFHGISSIDQLEAPAAGRLGLFSLQLDAVPNGPLSITSQLANLKAIGASAQELERRLTELGFTPGQHPEFEDERYELKDVRFYEVDADFPRIIRSHFKAGDLPPGILGVRYDIDITNEPPKSLLAGAVEEWLAEFACPAPH